MLPIGSSVQDAMNDHSAGIVGEASRRRMVRIVMNESGEFADPGAFLGAEYKVSSQSDRAGLRLEGPRVASLSAGRMISEEMMWGAVQIPEDGRPIVLNVDYPVTGGYPVIGCVAAVDQPVLGQLRPGDAMRFEAVTREQARQLFRDRS
jgi:allophanate hydrolase subunit 2